MPRRYQHCPAREGRTSAFLLVIDGYDLPACLVLSAGRPDVPFKLPQGRYGPCVDCRPTPTLRERWRRLWRRRG